MKAYVLGYADVYDNRMIHGVTLDGDKANAWLMLNFYARIAGGVSQQSSRCGWPKDMDVSYAPRIREHAERKLMEAGIENFKQTWEWPHWVEEFEVS